MPEIISKVLTHNLFNMQNRKKHLENFSVIYSGQNPNTGKYETLLLNITEAIKRGDVFVTNDTTFKLTEEDNLLYHVYKHCKYLDVKIENTHEFTMKEMVAICPMILIDLIKAKGGKDYIAKVLIGYEELYNQQNK